MALEGEQTLNQTHADPNTTRWRSCIVNAELGSAVRSTPSNPTMPRRSFEQACDEVIAYLMNHSPMGMWAVTRVEGSSQDSQSILATQAPAYPVKAGAVFPFHTSLCKVMATGQGSPVVPDAAHDPAYRDAVAATAELGMIIGAYAGTPILGPTGQLFGALCGFSPERQSETLRSLEPLLLLLGGLLASAMESDLRAHDADQAIADAQHEAETDALTGLLNRRGWQRVLDVEASPLLRFGGSAHILIVDLDGLKNINDTRGHDAGDHYIQIAAEVLHRTTRGRDRIARIGGDEFAILALGADPAQAQKIQRSLEAEFANAEVSASVGCSPFTTHDGFAGAWRLADQAMYIQKRSRRTDISNVMVPTQS